MLVDGKYLVLTDSQRKYLFLCHISQTTLVSKISWLLSVLFLEDKINVQKESQMNKYDLKYLDWIDLDLNSNSDLDWLSYV